MAGRANRRHQIPGQFAWRVIPMLQSPAYRVLSLSEHRILARLEIELADHGGADNGKLPATYDDFEQYGVHRQAIAPALRGLEALGFIEITVRGRAGNAEWRRPNVFRLTYRHTQQLDPTDEWRVFETIGDAEAVADAARKASRKQKSSGGKRTITSGENRTTNRHSHSTETTTTAHSTETTTTLDISGEGSKVVPIGELVTGLVRAARERAAHPTGKRAMRAG